MNPTAGACCWYDAPHNAEEDFADSGDDPNGLITLANQAAPAGFDSIRRVENRIGGVHRIGEGIFQIDHPALRRVFGQGKSA